MVYSAEPLGDPLIADNKVLILDSYDLRDNQPSNALRDRHPRAKLSYVKIGGAYPYLAAPDEVLIYLEVHLRNCGYFPSYDDDDASPLPRQPHSLHQGPPVPLFGTTPGNKGPIPVLGELGGDEEESGRSSSPGGLEEKDYMKFDEKTGRLQGADRREVGEFLGQDGGQRGAAGAPQEDEQRPNSARPRPQMRAGDSRGG